MNVIGLTGFAGSGKSTVANYLVEEHGYTRLSFAAPLKAMLRTLNPIIGEMYGETYLLSELLEVHSETQLKASEWGPEYRRLLQVLATDCIRAIDENFWVRAALRQITDADDKVVFDDVRFPNEAQVISGYNPWGLWNVTRPGYEAVNGHSSEAHAGKMGEFVTISNVASLGFLKNSVDHALDLAFSDTAALA